MREILLAVAIAMTFGCSTKNETSLKTAVKNVEDMAAAFGEVVEIGCTDEVTHKGCNNNTYIHFECVAVYVDKSIRKFRCTGGKNGCRPLEEKR